MSSHRRRRQERSRVREWTPDHYWPADRGWPDDPDDDQWHDDQWHDDQRPDEPRDGWLDEREAQTSPLRRLRPERPHPPKGREWTPDHHWPEDQGWPDRRGRRREGDGERRHDGPMAAVITFVLAALFVAGLGGYGIIRQHHAAVTALRQAATMPCAHLTGAAATRCRSSAPGVTDGSGQPAPVASGSATPPRAPVPASGPASAARQPTPSRPATATATPPPATAPAPAPSPVTSTGPPPGTASSAAAQVLTLINQARAQAGLAALAISSGLGTSALGHTMVMAAGCGLSHQCPGEPALGARETAAGVTWTSAGENIGEGGPEPDTTSDIAAMAVGLTQAMLNEKPPDDGHRLNILSTSFHHIGIYVLRDASGTVWMTQDFSN